MAAITKPPFSELCGCVVIVLNTLEIEAQAFERLPIKVLRTINSKYQTNESSVSKPNGEFGQ
jgi:hypothetical protein